MAMEFTENTVTFLSQISGRIPGIRNLQRGKINFGSPYQRFQRMVA